MDRKTTISLGATVAQNINQITNLAELKNIFLNYQGLWKTDRYFNDSIKKINAVKLSTKPIYNNKPQILKDFQRSNYYFNFKLRFYTDTNYVTTPLENFNWKLINETKTMPRTCSALTSAFISNLSLFLIEALLDLLLEI